MKKLMSIKNPLFNTLEEKEMKHVWGGSMTVPTATGPSPIYCNHSNGRIDVDGTEPGYPDDGNDKG